jgi:hypothetical protein
VHSYGGIVGINDLPASTSLKRIHWVSIQKARKRTLMASCGILVLPADKQVNGMLYAKGDGNIP